VYIKEWVNKVSLNMTKEISIYFTEEQKATCFDPSLGHHQANFDLHKYQYMKCKCIMGFQSVYRST
jgi:hypothetical protein